MSASGATQQPIAVGVDSSLPSQAALRWAVRQAKLTGALLRTVTVWRSWPVLDPTSPAPTPPPLPDRGRQAATTLSRTVSDALGDEADVEVEQFVLEGHAVARLLEQAADACLLVVGSRGHGGFAGMLLGWVSTHCVSHASCPVVVVPGCRGAPLTSTRRRNRSVQPSAPPDGSRRTSLADWADR